ncbi:MAG: transcription elongation factor GreA [Lachnospiraceae bacterium]|nr:transcription elongation factor GreA [Lachnospiraceae bacterium]
MNNELTRKDIEDMQAEIDHRKLVLRPQLLEDVKEARAHGDLSENFEYHAAKRAKNQNESRIRFLERMIRTARIIEDHTAADEAGINKRITIYVPEDDVEEVYTIVSTIREDSLLGLISVESPLGKALLGHKPGDRLSVQVNPQFSYEVIVRKVEDADEANNAELARY